MFHIPFQRRDFTINALALREDGEVIDLFDGLEDLQKHLIKAVGNPNERFHEDALRMMRAVRFASKLDFVIDTATLKGIKGNAPLLEKIAVERIRVELEKLLLGQNPVAGLKDFIATGLYQYCPGLENAQAALSALLILNQWHLENEVQLWSVLSLQLQLDQKEIGKFLKKWKTANDLIAQVKKVVPAVQAIRQRTLTPTLMFNTGETALHDANQVAKLYGWAINDEELQKAYQKLPIKNAKELAIDGRILITKAGVKPGPLMGKILQQLMLAVVNGEIANDATTLLEKVEEITKEG